MGGDKKPSAQYFVGGGHGKTVLAEVSVREADAAQRAAHHRRDLVALEHLGSTAATPAACSRSRSPRRRSSRRCSRRQGRTWGWSAPAAWRTTSSNRSRMPTASTWQFASPVWRWARWAACRDAARARLSLVAGLHRAGQRLPPGADRRRHRAVRGALRRRFSRDTGQRKLRHRPSRIERPHLSVIVRWAYRPVALGQLPSTARLGCCSSLDRGCASNARPASAACRRCASPHCRSVPHGLAGQAAILATTDACSQKRY